MATKAYTGAGLSVTVNGSTVGQVKQVQVPVGKWATDDISNAASPAAGSGVIKEVLPTVLDPGECSISGVFVYNDAGQAALLTAFNTGALVPVVITLPKGEGQTSTGNTYSFSGFVTDAPMPDTSFDKSITFKTTIKANTVITVTVGS
jgi:hypothetical protein